MAPSVHEQNQIGISYMNFMISAEYLSELERAQTDKPYA